MRFLKKFACSVVIIFVAVNIVSSFLSPVYACGGFAVFPLEGKQHFTEDDTNVMIAFRDGQETLIIEPSYKGNASEFGIVVPVPSKPTLQNVPKELFGQLEDMTHVPNMRDWTFGVIGSLGGVDSGVQIIEKKDVGDYKATVLTADSSRSLIQWLMENTYQYHQQDEKNFDYYIQKGGYYFVALKVNLDVVSSDASGLLQEKLNPIGIVFDTQVPTLSLHIEANTMPVMTFNLYILSPVPYYVPGSDITFSRPVTENDLTKAPALLKYDGVNQWLIRQVVRFDPTKIQEDLTLTQGNEQLQITNGVTTKVNERQLPAASGILTGEQGVSRTIDLSYSAARTPKPLLFQMRLIGGLIVGVIGILLFVSILVFRATLHNTDVGVLKRFLSSFFTAIFACILALAAATLTWQTLDLVIQNTYPYQPLVYITTIFFFFLPAYFFSKGHGKKWFFITIFFQGIIIAFLLAYIRFIVFNWSMISYISKLILFP